MTNFIKAATIMQENGRRLRLTIDVLLDALVRENAAAVHIHLVSDRHIVAQHADILQSGPAADG